MKRMMKKPAATGGHGRGGRLYKLAGARSEEIAREGLTSLEDVLAEDLKDPAFRAEWERNRIIVDTAVAVREMREIAGLTQDELATATGTSKPAISRLESGKARSVPGLDLLNRLAEACGHHVSVTLKKGRETSARRRYVRRG